MAERNISTMKKRIIIFIFACFCFVKIAHPQEITFKHHDKEYIAKSIGKGQIEVSQNNKVICTTEPLFFEINGEKTYSKIYYMDYLDIGNDGDIEIVCLVDPPDRLSPHCIVFYYENKVWKRCLEGIPLFYEHPRKFNKFDFHTFGKAADVKFIKSGNEIKPQKELILDDVSKAKNSIVLFPNFIHMQLVSYNFLVDARSTDFNDDDCARIIFANPEHYCFNYQDNMIAFSYGNLLTIIHFSSIDKNKQIIDYGIFTIRADSNIDNIILEKSFLKCYLKNKTQISYSKKDLKFNYCNNGKWWRK